MNFVEFLWFLGFISINLAVVNFLPIPPLDGYNVALAFLPPRQAMLLRRYAVYGIAVLLVLVLLNSMGSPIDPLGWILRIAGFVARLLIGA